MELMVAHYLTRERWYGGVLDVKPLQSAPLTIYRAMALVHLDRVAEALQLLEPLLNQSTTHRAALTAMIYAHKRCQTIDGEAMERLKQETEEKLEPEEPYLEALVLYLGGEAEEASRLIENGAKGQPLSSRTLTLLGWLDLDLKKTRTALRHFEQAVALEKDNADALMGQVKALGGSEGLAKVSGLVVRFPKCTAPLMEKMTLQLELKLWQDSQDTALRALGLHSSNIMALKITALKPVVDGNYEEAVPVLKKLHTEIERQELKAWWIYLDVLSVVMRCCGGHEATLAVLEDYEASCLKWGSEEGLVHAEAGRLQMLLQKRTQAERETAEACRLDPHSVPFLAQLTEVHLWAAGLSNQVVQEMEFLSEVSGPDPKEPLLCYLLALSRPSQSLELLDRAVASLQARASLLKFGSEHLAALDPSLLVRIASAYPDSRPGDKRRARVLSLVAEVCPGLTQARLALVRAQVALERFEEASAALTDIDHPEACLIAAHIHLQLGEIEKAGTGLELGLSENLSLREMAGYHLVSGMVAARRGEDDKCVAAMRTALRNNTGEHKLTDKELGMVYTELSGAYMRLHELNKAEEALKEAGELLKGTDQEVRLSMERAHLTAVQGDPRKALVHLSEVPTDHPYYVQSEMKKAQIYLEHLKDDRGYAECYKRLVEADPSSDNLVLLGEAYLAVQEPDLAVQSYEKAMMVNSGNTKLSTKLARTLVKCHFYNKAIKSYKNAGEEGAVELGELLVKLGQLDKAEEAVAELPVRKKALLLAKIHEKRGDIEKALNTLEKAQGEISRGDSEAAGRVLYQMGSYAALLRDSKTGIEYFKKALAYIPNSVLTQISLAKLYMQTNDWTSCEAICRSALSKDPNNEPALLMVADLSLRRLDLSSAAIHFSSLLDTRPDFWLALARLVEVNRRAARLEQSLPYLEAARGTSPSHPALHYCTGLYYLYNGEKQKGIEEMNKARRDAEWGRQAIHDMIEACLEAGDTSAAERLLSEMEVSSSEEKERVQLLASFIRLASGDRIDAERAMTDLTRLANSEAHRVGATLGLAQGYVAQKQSNRAKTVLKRVARTPWSMEEADYLERCWLVLAELYVTSGNPDLASDLLQRVISHNKSSAKAYQLLALLAEKDQKHGEASGHYRRAWSLSGETDPALGYKLAFNQLKGKRYADAVATCQQVLATHPDYPKIKKEIFDKALKKLRS